MREKLNVRRWLFASIAVFVLYSLLEYLSKELIFMPIYPELFPELPGDQGGFLPRLYTYLGRAVFSVMFAFIYTKGYEGKSVIGEGLRYGTWIAILVIFPAFLKALVVTSLPVGALVRGLFVNSAETMVFGLVVAFIYGIPSQRSKS